MQEFNTNLVSHLAEWVEITRKEGEAFQNQVLSLFLGMVRRGDLLPNRVWLEPNPTPNPDKNRLVLWWKKARYNRWHFADGVVTLIEEPEDRDEDETFQGNQVIPLSYWEAPSGRERLENWHRKYYSFSVSDSTIETPFVVLKTPFQSVQADFDDFNTVSPLRPTIDRMLENALDKFEENKAPRRYRLFMCDWPKYELPEPEARAHAETEIRSKLATLVWPIIKVEKWGNTDNFQVTIEAEIWQSINETIVREALSKIDFRIISINEIPIPKP